MGKLVAARLVFNGVLGEKPPPASAPRAVRVLGCGGFYHGWSLDSGASMSPAPEVRLELIQERIPPGGGPYDYKRVAELDNDAGAVVATLSVCMCPLCMLLQMLMQLLSPGVPLEFWIAHAVATSRGAAGVADAVAIHGLVGGVREPTLCAVEDSDAVAVRIAPGRR